MNPAKPHPDAADSIEVARRLDALEREFSVKVVFACESGSRAWGFPSAGSDYDVRFIYVHSHDWYLTIDVEDRRDVIETPLEGLWDLNGWDLRKSLRLMYRSNAALSEWLQSPIIYRETTTAAEQMRAILPRLFRPKSTFHHYLAMASSTCRGSLQGPAVRLKKYFYALRPILACRWIENGMGVVPTEFGKLLDQTVEDNSLRMTLQDLITLKRSGEESDEIAQIDTFKSFIESELERLESVEIPEPKRILDTSELSRIFRNVIADAQLEN